jgi:hypothetical protein
VTACGDSGLTAVDAAGARIPLQIVTAVVLPNLSDPATIETASISVVERALGEIVTAVPLTRST